MILAYWDLTVMGGQTPVFQEPLIGSFHTVADSRVPESRVEGSSLMKKVQIQ